MVTASLAAGSAAAAGATRGFAFGGLVEGGGTATSDSILARLSSGEFVMNADATAAIGPDALAEANRSGQLPATGGGPVQVNVGIFGVESAAQRWAESQEGQTTLVNLVRREVGRYS
jgi:cellulose synthase/poly-beta-1,6-N-acetylglucosamine synthase-like glycosyltransferase